MRDVVDTEATKKWLKNRRKRPAELEILAVAPGHITPSRMAKEAQVAV